MRVGDFSKQKSMNRTGPNERERRAFVVPIITITNILKTMKKKMMTIQ